MKKKSSLLEGTQIFEGSEDSVDCSCSRPSFRNKNRSRWSPQENIRYAAYLKDHLLDFSSQELRKKKMVFTVMAKHMLTRTTSQVKSHHQKMTKRHGNPQAIIRHINAQYAKSVAAKKRKNIKKTLQLPPYCPPSLQKSNLKKESKWKQ